MQLTVEYHLRTGMSVLTLTCENDISTDEENLHVTCHSNGSWIPDPAQFTCSSFTTMPTGAITYPNNNCTMSFFDRIFFFSQMQKPHQYRLESEL